MFGLKVLTSPLAGIFLLASSSCPAAMESLGDPALHPNDDDKDVLEDDVDLADEDYDDDAEGSTDDELNDDDDNSDTEPRDTLVYACMHDVSIQ